MNTPSPVLNDKAAADIALAMSGGLLPEQIWEIHDDACDCTFQRLGMWTNPYMGETLEVRMCCIWAELYKIFPNHVRTTKAFLNPNTDEWEPGTWEWDGEDDMPRSVWYRQLRNRTGRTLEEIREEYAEQEPPRGTIIGGVTSRQLSFSQQLALKSVMEERSRLDGVIGAILSEAGCDPTLVWDITPEGIAVLA